jgi:hypothetical protein
MFGSMKPSNLNKIRNEAEPEPKRKKRYSIYSPNLHFGMAPYARWEIIEARQRLVADVVTRRLVQRAHGRVRTFFYPHP